MFPGEFKMTSRLALAAALAFALAACGGDNAADEAGDAAAEAVATATPAPTDSATPAAEAAPGDDATASPTPTPSASATTARATPTAAATVAAAGPPETYKQCAICHKVERGQHGLGPSLAGVFGAKSGHAAGFNYSDAMEGANLTWNQATLDRFLTNPQGVVPGTTMAFAGIKDAAKRAEVIDYLKTL